MVCTATACLSNTFRFHSFHKYSPGSYYGPEPLQVLGNHQWTEQKIPILRNLTFLQRRQIMYDSQRISKLYVRVWGEKKEKKTQSKVVGSVVGEEGWAAVLTGVVRVCASLRGRLSNKAFKETTVWAVWVSGEEHPRQKIQPDKNPKNKECWPEKCGNLEQSEQSGEY